jgi:hypothetical protein
MPGFTPLKSGSPEGAASGRPEARDLVRFDFLAVSPGRRLDQRNTAARPGQSGGGTTTLRHYADPVPEVDKRAAAYLAKLTAGSAAQSG